MIKQLVSISATALTFAIQGVAFAQANQGSPISEQDYIIVVSAVCKTQGDATQVEDAVASMGSRSVSSQKIRQLQEIAVEMYSLPEVEKEIICME